jgi:hypothetical protein
MEQVQQAPRVRRSGRVVHALERYLGLYEILHVGDIDSLTYHKAMSREDSGRMARGHEIRNVIHGR